MPGDDRHPPPDPLVDLDVDAEQGGEGPCLAELVDDHRDAPAQTNRPQAPEGDAPSEEPG